MSNELYSSLDRFRHVSSTHPARQKEASAISPPVRLRNKTGTGLVSVVLPTYNRAHCLGRAIESVLRQGHANYEIIIIDDGSSDDTAGMVRSKFPNEPRIKYAYQKNSGVTAARNVGLSMSQGEFIALLDSDDQWFPWKLQAQIDCLRRFENIGMVWTDMQAIDPSGRIVDPAYLRTMYHAYRHFRAEELFPLSVPLVEVCPDIGAVAGAMLRIGDVFPQILMGNLVHTSTVVMTRARFEMVKTFSQRSGIAGQDYDFHLRTCSHGTVALIDHPSVQYQIGFPDRLTGSRYRTEAAVNALQTVRPYFAHGVPAGLTRRLVRQRLAELHAWIGECMLDDGRRRESTGHLLRSLCYGPFSRRQGVLLLAALLPPRVVAMARVRTRSLRRWVHWLVDHPRSKP